MNYAPNEPMIRRAEIPSTELQGETVLLSLEEQSYFGLRGTSQRIWQLLAQPCTQEQILDVLVTEYEVDRAQCERDITTFLQKLWEVHLIVPASSAAH